MTTESILDDDMPVLDVAGEAGVTVRGGPPRTHPVSR
jgi:hypothetical protein